MTHSGVKLLREAIVFNAMMDLKWAYMTLLELEPEEDMLMRTKCEILKSIKNKRAKGEEITTEQKMIAPVNFKIEKIEKARRFVGENEIFFHSEWYKYLMDIDGDEIIIKVQELAALDHKGKRPFKKEYMRKLVTKTKD